MQSTTERRIFQCHVSMMYHNIIFTLTENIQYTINKPHIHFKASLHYLDFTVISNISDI